MSADHPPWNSDWTVGVRVWLERAGQAILGPGRQDLLEGIGRWHSISEAARQIGMSYRRAWLLVQSVNEAAGAPLVEATTGGSHGGGARLTPLGERALAVYGELRDQLHGAATAVLQRLVLPPETEPLHVAAAVSLEEALNRLLADYSLRQPAVRVRTIYGASDELADHLLAGAPGDLFLSAELLQLDRLEAAGVVRSGERRALVETGLAAVGPADRPAAVRKAADLARPSIRRLAVARPECPLGRYARAYLQGLGLYESLLPRLLTVDNSRSVTDAVRAGQADVGLVYASDAYRASDCRLLFRVRKAKAAVCYSAAVIARGRQPEQARALLDFLASRPAAARFRQCGFQPVH